MCLLFETIRIENGVPCHLWWHEQRMNQARAEMWHSEVPMVLAPIIRVPDDLLTGLVRCNIRYGPDILDISYKRYEKRVIRSLKLLACDDIDYHLKFTDRARLESLFSLRGSADEIIVVRNGFITDTSMSNVIFFDGKGWSTPANPLLRGTCRNRMVAEGKVAEQDIPPQELNRYTGCKLINAMRDPDREELIPVSEIS